MPRELINGQCRGTLSFRWDFPGEKEPHTCTLPERHWGEHLCWCGCLFNGGRVVGRQMPPPGAPVTEVQEIGPYVLIHHVETP